MNRMRVAALVASLLFALIATYSLARAQSPHGDAAKGATLHDKDCVACHVRRLGGDGSGMYTRSDRRIKTLAALKAQVARCNAELSTGYFPDEEDHVAAYLNLRYYKLKD